MHFGASDLVSSLSLRKPAELSSQFEKLSPSSEDSCSTFTSGSWDAVDSFFGPNSVNKRPDLTFKRIISAESNDSSSTVADESWNPVEEFIGNSSSDEELNIRYGVSLFDANAYLGTPPKLVMRLNKDPSDMSFADVRDTYPLEYANMAGPKDGTAVWDAAYVSGKAPETELEWTDVQLVPKHGMSTLTSDAVSTADSASLLDTASMKETAPLEGIASLINTASSADPALLKRSADVTHRHDSETGTYQQVIPAREAHDNLVPVPTNSEEVLQDFLHELPTQTIRFIAEDAGSIFDYRNGSDGDDKQSPLVEHDMPRLVNAAVSVANDEDSEEEFPIRGDDFFPTILPSDFRRHNNSDHQDASHHERHEPTGFLHRVVAHMPKLPRLRRHHQHGLDRNFQFPNRDDDSQRMMSTPLLNENDHVPGKQYERRSPFGRVLDTLKGKDKGAGKLVKYRTGPRKSFLRRQVARLDTFLERKNW